MLPGSAVKGLDAAYGGFFIRFQSRVYFENTSSECTPAQSSHVPQATGHWAIGHRPESAPNAQLTIAPGSGHGPGQQVPKMRLMSDICMSPLFKSFRNEVFADYLEPRVS